MRLSEHELTESVKGVAKTVLASQRGVRRGAQDVDQVWEAMDRYERYQLLAGVGAQVLPVLVALPDVEVRTGERATYTDEQVQAVVETLPLEGGRLKRAVLLKARVQLVQVALGHVPLRTDPDTLEVPDHL